jgi:hypothetical protein
MHTLDFALQPLVEHLQLGNPEVARFVVSCFSLYVLDFLQSHPNALDPQLAQIRARVHLTMAHRPVGWLWTQHTPDAMRLWGQEEHATSFVLRVLDYAVNKGLCPKDCSVDRLVDEVYQRLCVLQSLWQGNGVWVEDRRLQEALRGALLTAMEEVQRLDVI